MQKSSTIITYPIMTPYTTQIEYSYNPFIRNSVLVLGTFIIISCISIGYTFYLLTSIL
jgi:hypothetical protein